MEIWLKTPPFWRVVGLGSHARSRFARENKAQGQTRAWGVYTETLLRAALRNKRASGVTQTAVDQRRGA